MLAEMAKNRLSTIMTVEIIAAMLSPRATFSFSYYDMNSKKGLLIVRQSR
jgi:hypothetical protein